MHKSLGSFRAALLIGWMALSAAGLLYARGKGIPTWVAVPVVAAFLLEYSFYLVPGFESARERLETMMSEVPLALALGASALLPYLVYSLGTHQFHWLALTRLAAVAFTVSLWYAVLPRTPWTDIAFLALLAAVVLRKLLDSIFVPPLPDLHVEVLGQLMLIHLGAAAVLMHRRGLTASFGFIPNRTEWAIGTRNFLYFLPIGFPLALATHLIRFTPGVFGPWKTLGIFLGFLWVVALSEEFFFRGLLQRCLAEWTGDATAARAIASALFGLCHLGFGVFPNWRMALLAGILGWFCGRSFDQANSIRAAMVTHVLIVTIWRSLFSS